MYNTSNYEADRPLPTEKNKNMIGITKGKGKLGGGIMREVAVLRQRMYIQPAHNVPTTYPEGPLKVLTFGTSRGLSGDQHKN